MEKTGLDAKIGFGKFAVFEKILDVIDFQSAGSYIVTDVTRPEYVKDKA